VSLEIHLVALHICNVIYIGRLSHSESEHTQEESEEVNLEVHIVTISKKVNRCTEKSQCSPLILS
jgi:hypothetical protein